MSLLDEMLQIAVKVAPVARGSTARATHIPFINQCGSTGSTGSTKKNVIRNVFRFRLAERPQGYCTLIAPDWSLDDAKQSLAARYGDRLLDVVAQERD
jgi:hypothetical protein